MFWVETSLHPLLKLRDYLYAQFKPLWIFVIYGSCTNKFYPYIVRVRLDKDFYARNLNPDIRPRAVSERDRVDKLIAQTKKNFC